MYTYKLPCNCRCWETVPLNKPQEKTAQTNCSLLPYDILTAPRSVPTFFLFLASTLKTNVICTCYFCRLELQRAYWGLHFWLCLCLQCWCWPDGDFLCIEYSSGAGESRRDPGCLPDSEEPQTAETPHGADTGKDLLHLNFDFSFIIMPHYAASLSLTRRVCFHYTDFLERCSCWPCLGVSNVQTQLAADT